MKKSFITVRDMVEIAMLVALAIVLDLPFLKIRIQAGGGSISFTMLPLLILGFRQGFIKGFIGAGIVYGIITCIIDDSGTLANYPFDYFLGYGSMALGGLFSSKVFKEEKISPILYVVGITLACLGRVVGSTLSSLIIYKYTLGASLVYNISYIGFSYLACLVVLIILYPTLIRINRIYPTRHSIKEII